MAVRRIHFFQIIRLSANSSGFFMFLAFAANIHQVSSTALFKSKIITPDSGISIPSTR